MASPYQPQQQLGRPIPTSGMAVTSMVLGIIGLALFCVWFIAVICDVLAIIFGAVALQQTKAGKAGGQGMAIAGIVCGIVSLAGVVIYMAFWGTVFWKASNEFRDGMQQIKDLKDLKIR